MRKRETIEPPTDEDQSRIQREMVQRIRRGEQISGLSWQVGLVLGIPQPQMEIGIRALFDTGVLVYSDDGAGKVLVVDVIENRK